MKPGILTLSATIACAAGLLTCASGLRAQESTGHHYPPGQKSALVSMLSGLKIDPDQIVMTVDGEKAWPEADPKPDSTTPMLVVITSIFGEIVNSFGPVQAIGAQKMELVNQRPDNPNIWDGMPPQDAVKIFLTTLSASQWQALTGNEGLSYSELGTEQQTLYIALIGSKKLQIREQTQDSYDPEKIPSYANDLPQSRLRFGQRIRVLVPQRGVHNGGFAFPALPGRYYVMQDGANAHDELFGVPVRETLPHTPKDGQLPFDMPALRADINLTDIKTVGDLLGLIAKATQIEIYADPHYETRTVGIYGSRRNCSAADLLQALAFCVAGTYRRVGTAYVLSQDIAGTGTIRERWNLFEADGNAMREKAMVEARKKMDTLPEPATLPVLNEELAFTPEQTRVALAEKHPIGIQSLKMPFKDLTSQQRQAASRMWNLMPVPDAAVANGENDTLDDKDVMLQSDTELQLIVPSLPNPVVISQTNGIFNDRLQRERGGATDPEDLYTIPERHLANNYPYQAILAQTSMLGKDDALITAMAVAHLNELWIDASQPDVAATSIAGLGKTDPKVRIVPVVDLFMSSHAPAEYADLTILGETLPEAKERLRRREGIIASARGETAPEDEHSQTAISPFSAEAVSSLKSSVSRLVSMPETGGIAWRNTDLPGYSNASFLQLDDLSLQLGYTVTARLAFLRKWHCDPIDINPNSNNTVSVRTALTAFDDSNYEVDTQESDHWNEFRAEAEKKVIGDLYKIVQTEARKSKTDFPIFVRQRHSPANGEWYSIWPNPDAPLPDIVPDSPNPHDETHRIEVISPASIRYSELKPSWAGFIIDLSQGRLDISSPEKAIQFVNDLARLNTH